MGLVLFGWILLHTLVLDGPGRSLLAPLASYKELLFLPLLFALFRLCSRSRWFLSTLAAGTLAWAAGLLGVPAGSRPWPPWCSRTASRPASNSPCSRYLMLEHARRAAHPWLWRAGAAFLAATVLFALDGRTGQLVLIVLLTVAAWRHSPRRWRIAALVVAPVLVVAVALGSGAVQRRIAETASAVEQTTGPPGTSTAIRIELARHGLTVAREHWLLGGGYTHYAQLHQEAVRRAYANDPSRRDLWQSFWARTPNPHNEYLMQLAGGGIVSLALFLAWLGMPLLRRRADGTASPALLGAVLAFAIGCLFNSLLMDFVEGHYYTALLAWLLAREGTARA